MRRTPCYRRVRVKTFDQDNHIWPMPASINPSVSRVWLHGPCLRSRVWFDNGCRGKVGVRDGGGVCDCQRIPEDCLDGSPDLWRSHRQPVSRVAFCEEETQILTLIIWYLPFRSSSASSARMFRSWSSAPSYDWSTWTLNSGPAFKRLSSPALSQSEGPRRALWLNTTTREAPVL